MNIHEVINILEINPYTKFRSGHVTAFDPSVEWTLRDLEYIFIERPNGETIKSLMLEAEDWLISGFHNEF